MKLKNIIALLTLTAISAIHLQLSTSQAQGLLTPPAGAPSPMMKSLDQIEARTPISSASFTISKPGSYYLTTNLMVSSGNAITIATTNVSLDLNGFALISSEANPAGSGIYINPGMNNISIQNGFISGGTTNSGSGVSGGPGFLNGIVSVFPYAKAVRVSRVGVSKCKGHGIYLNRSTSSSVENCQVQTVGNMGITADVVTSSSALDCGGTSVSGNTVNNCRGYSTSPATGISATTADNCHGDSNSGIGIDAEVVSDSYGSGGIGTGIKGRVANNCFGNSNGSGNGIEVTESATGCSAFSASGIALIAVVANNCTASQSGGRAIQATVANGCYATAGTNLIVNKYNMP